MRDQVIHIHKFGKGVDLSSFKNFLKKTGHFTLTKILPTLGLAVLTGVATKAGHDIYQGFKEHKTDLAVHDNKGWYHNYHGSGLHHGGFLPFLIGPLISLIAHKIFHHGNHPQPVAPAPPSGPSQAVGQTGGSILDFIKNLIGFGYHKHGHYIQHRGGDLLGSILPVVGSLLPHLLPLLFGLGYPPIMLDKHRLQAKGLSLPGTAPPPPGGDGLFLPGTAPSNGGKTKAKKGRKKGGK